MNWDSAAFEQVRRNQCAVLDHYGFPPLQLIATLKERCLWHGTVEFLALLSGSKNFRLWHWNGQHGAEAERGWRENVPQWSMQIVQHGSVGDILIETDIDRNNPDYGLWFAGRHWVQDVLLGKPNPSAVRDGLRRRGVPV